MFEYKNISFFNEYFSSLPDFQLSQEFVQEEQESVQEEQGENKKIYIYIGKIESVNTVHPMSIKVEIPTTFPHSKLLFWTESLRGYPHLIEGKKRKDSWFCLNTPFAETAEEQLEQEMLRLRDWIKRFVRKDLPTVIKDPEVYRALYMMNAYSWENIDEMNEYKQDARLTFVGDFATHKEYFKEKKGKFNCIKNRSERIFVLKNKLGTNFELPYIIVDEIPTIFTEFVGLKEQFGWDEEICEFLLPGLNTGKSWVSSIHRYNSEDRKKYSEVEANQILDEIEQELHKDEPKLKAKCIPFGKTMKLKDVKADSNTEFSVPDYHKSLLFNEIHSLKEKVKKEQGWKMYYDFKPWKDWTKEDWDRDDEIHFLAEKDQYELHHFALGVIEGKGITWFVISTNKASGSYDKVEYELTLCNVEMLHLVSKGCDIEIAQTITEKEYFGRGNFSSKWNERKVCVVGIGAIGSIVCESLARSGVSVIALWDDDTVEPGNICRSTFQVQDIGKSKVETLREHIVSINPFIELSTITTKGYWFPFTGINGNTYSGPFQYMHGAFYGSVNYASQEEAIKLLDKYDLIIDCTGSNELLHFLSYAVPKKEIISMCITNRSRNLLLFSSNDGNPFELRKMYLSKIEQDTENFYVESSGCYSPTFIATYSDIATLVNFAIKELNTRISKNQLVHSVIWSYDNRGIIADRLKTYAIPNSKIRMTISSETLMDGEEMSYSANEEIGYLLGGYSADGTIVMISHIIESENAKGHLDYAFRLSGGIIDYLGDYVYSDGNTGSYKGQYQDIIAAKASDENININNPVLAIRNQDGTLSFYLYLAGKLEKFIPLD